VTEEYIRAVTDVSNYIDAFAYDAEDLVTEQLNVQAAIYDRLVDEFGEKKADEITQEVAETGTYTESLSDKIINALGSGVTDMGKTLGDVIDKALGSINLAIPAIGDFLKGLVTTLTAFFAPIIEAITSTWDKVVDKVKEWIGDRVADITHLVDGLWLNFQGTLTWLGEEFGKLLNDAVTKLIPSLELPGKNIESATKKVEGSGVIGLLSTILPYINKAIEGVGELTDTEEGSVNTEAKAVTIELEALVGAIVGAPFGLLPVIQDVYSAGLGEIVRHDAQEVFRATKLPAPTLVEAGHRELIPLEKYSHDLARQGFADADINVIYQLYLKLLDIDTLRAAYLRGEISEGRVISEMAKQGYQDGDIEIIKKLFYFIPGVQDLIRMAVREAFSPEIAEKFGQYQDFPTQLAEWGAKQGLSEDWAKAYWASHWELPGANMGFEMLHRGIITEDELKLLLRALDVMPFWRDKLIKLSYIPFTRVDVRRMHKMGIITDEELVTSYMDIGYAPDKAAKLAEFTMLYNREPEANEQTAADTRKAKDKDLTKGDILKGYHDGLLPVDDTRKALLDIGYSQEEMDYYVNREDFLIEQERVNTYLNNFHAAYVKGTIDYNQLIDLLGQLNLPTSQVESLISLWSIEKSLKAAKPTKSELLGWWKKKLISDDDCYNELASLGYADQYIKLYMSKKTEVVE